METPEGLSKDLANKDYQEVLEPGPENEAKSKKKSA